MISPYDNILARNQNNIYKNILVIWVHDVIHFVKFGLDGIERAWEWEARQKGWGRREKFWIKCTGSIYLYTFDFNFLLLCFVNALEICIFEMSKIKSFFKNTFSLKYEVLILSCFFNIANCIILKYFQFSLIVHWHVKAK